MVVVVVVLSKVGNAVAVDRDMEGSEVGGLKDMADCCAARSAADAEWLGMLPDFGDDEKNWAILFVVFEVDDARLRVEGAMMGIAGAGVAAVE